MDQQRNLIIAVILSTAIIFGWGWLFEKPKLEQDTIQVLQKAEIKRDEFKVQNQHLKKKSDALISSAASRIKINNDKFLLSIKRAPAL